MFQWRKTDQANAPVQRMEDHDASVKEQAPSFHQALWSTLAMSAVPAGRSKAPALLRISKTLCPDDDSEPSAGRSHPFRPSGLMPVLGFCPETSKAGRFSVDVRFHQERQKGCAAGGGLDLL
jgi:hypothetical protein